MDAVKEELIRFYVVDSILNILGVFIGSLFLIVTESITKQYAIMGLIFLLSVSFITGYYDFKQYVEAL